MPAQQRASIGNILPLNRSFSRKLSDSLRLKMSAAELSRAQSRPASGLSGG